MGNSLIVKNKITQLRKGYPTVSDKYNVQGGILQSGSANVAFGSLVKYGSSVGYYTAATSLAAVGDVAGILLATNVKLAGIWPHDSGTDTVTKPGEAFNLMLDGYVAVELDAAHTPNEVLPGKQLAIILATGKLTTADKIASGIVAMPGYFFTGIYENGVAEIEVRR